MRPLIWVLLLISVAFSVCFVRFQDYDKWSESYAQIDGEYIMSTLDAYHWLSVAQYDNPADNPFLGLLIKTLASTMHTDVEQIGFWLPVASSTVLALLIIAFALLNKAGYFSIISGLLVGISPFYLLRSRMGYLDTDIFVLTIPMLYAISLSTIVNNYSCSSILDMFLRKTRRADDYWKRRLSFRSMVAIAALSGLFSYYTVKIYTHFDIIHLALFIPSAVIIVLTSRSRRYSAILVLITYITASTYGTYAIAAMLPLLYILSLYGKRLSDSKSFLFILTTILTATLFITPGFSRLSSKFKVFHTYTSSSEVRSETTSPLPSSPNITYPNVVQSIIEASRISFGEFLKKLHPWPIVSVIGIAGYLACLIFHPSLFMLLPLFLLGVFSTSMGERMALFALPAFGLGFSFAVQLAYMRFKRIGEKEYLKPLFAIIIGLLLTWPAQITFASYGISPAISSQHAKALRSLQDSTPLDATIWEWWDWGYAAQYFAHRQTFADGGEHYGHHVFFLGKAFSSSSMAFSNKLIRYSASLQNRPWEAWSDKTTSDLGAFLSSLPELDDHAFSPEHKQYVAVTSGGLKMLPWMTYYGSYDMEAGRGKHGENIHLNERFDINTKQGLLSLASGQVVKLKSLDILKKNKIKRYLFQNVEGYHLVINEVEKFRYLMDSSCYKSTYTQLYLNADKTDNASKYFKMVYEGFPYVRIFEVL